MLLGSSSSMPQSAAGPYEMRASSSGPRRGYSQPRSEPLTDEVRPAGFVAKKCHHACERRHCVANYEKVLASAHERTHNHPGNSARICTPWPFSLDS